ncbi:MAG: GNAT family N-acetyltransferase [Rhizobiales bacterium]|nr:GNAT family N-acetyltransferase [Hyphomicrobiales bacterium]
MAIGRRNSKLPIISLPIETPRLVLRDFISADLDAVHAYSSRPEVSRFLIWGPNTLAQTREAIRDFQDDQKRKPRRVYELGIVPKHGKKIIGGVGLKVTDWYNRTGDIGYVLHPDSWGHGFAEEAARAMLAAGFHELGLHRITAICDQRNKASARVMERLGMRREGVFRQSKVIQGEWGDEYLYALLASDFNA